MSRSWPGAATFQRRHEAAQALIDDKRRAIDGPYFVCGRSECIVLELGTGASFHAPGALRWMAADAVPVGCHVGWSCQRCAHMCCPSCADVWATSDENLDDFVREYVRTEPERVTDGTG